MSLEEWPLRVGKLQNWGSIVGISSKTLNRIFSGSSCDHGVFLYLEKIFNFQIESWVGIFFKGVSRGFPPTIRNSMNHVERQLKVAKLGFETFSAPGGMEVNFYT